MNERRLSLKLPDRLFHGAAAIADARDITLAQLLRELLARELARNPHCARAPSGTAAARPTLRDTASGSATREVDRPATPPLSPS